MYKVVLFFLISALVVEGWPQVFETNKFKVGIEYENSLPMSGGSDRFRHRNNWDPFFVTITATAKNGYVISYLEVSAIIDTRGEVEFKVLRGQTGSKSMVFQLVTNNTDFLNYSYLAYGIREEEYKKVTNIITIWMRNSSEQLYYNYNTIMIFIALSLKYIL